MNRVLLPVLAIAAALMGCEGNTRQIYFIANETSGPVTVIHAHSSYIQGMDLDTVTVPSGERQELGMEDWLGGRIDPDLPATFIDTLLIYNADGVLTNRDWTLMDTWDIESFEDRKVPAQWRHEYTIEVSDSDF
jgi:hypothetical protein